MLEGINDAFVLALMVSVVCAILKPSSTALAICGSLFLLVLMT